MTESSGHTRHEVSAGVGVQALDGRQQVERWKGEGLSTSALWPGSQLDSGQKSRRKG